MSIPTSYSMYARGVTIYNYAEFADLANRIAVHEDHFEPAGKCVLQFFVDVHEGLTLGAVMLTLAELYELGITVHVTNV